MLKDENSWENFLVVAGGSNYHGNAGDTVELLDTTCPEQGWKMGMKYCIF